MNSKIEPLVVRVVALIAVFFLRKQGLGSPEELWVWKYDADRAATTYNWLMKNLKDRARDALLDLEREPGSEDNKADLRKQLTKLLQSQPSAVEYLADTVPESIGQRIIDIEKVSNALNVGNVQVGIFKPRDDFERG